MTTGNVQPSTHQEVRETPMYAVAGGRLVPAALVAAAGAAILLGFAIRTAVHGGVGGGRFGLWIGAALLAVAATGVLRGLVRLGPGEAVVVQLFGRYLGTLRRPGQWWVIPSAKRRKVSTRVRTHETAVLKVNDTEGVPIEIAMAVSWHVNDTAKALFAVEDYQAGAQPMRPGAAPRRFGSSLRTRWRGWCITQHQRGNDQ